MMKKSLVILAVVVIVVAGSIALRHSSSNKSMQMSDMPASSSSQNSADTANAVAATSVDITNFKFSPAVIKVKKGTTVTWHNKDGVAHTVTADAMPGPNSPSMDDGGTYTYAYTKAGTYTYHCDIHEDMKGTVVVTD